MSLLSDLIRLLRRLLVCERTPLIIDCVIYYTDSDTEPNSGTGDEDGVMVYYKKPERGWADVPIGYTTKNIVCERGFKGTPRSSHMTSPYIIRMFHILLLLLV